MSIFHAFGAVVGAAHSAIAGLASLGLPVALAIRKRDGGGTRYGSLTPSWTGTSWNGHCVLVLPDSERFVDATVARTLQTAKGVSQVTRVGGVAREINIIVDPDRLAAHGLPAAQVNNALRGVQLDVHAARAHYANNPDKPARNWGAVQLGLKNTDYFL